MAFYLVETERTYALNVVIEADSAEDAEKRAELDYDKFERCIGINAKGAMRIDNEQS